MAEEQKRGYFAHFDAHAPEPHPVIGWYNCHQLLYRQLPDPATMLEVTEDEWKGRMVNPSGWAVDNGVLVYLG